MADTRFDVIPYSDLSPEHTWTKLGKGSFGCVFKAEYLGLAVAVKEVLDSDEYDVSKYFNREVKVCAVMSTSLARLTLHQIMQEARHPNVVQYIGLCLAPFAPTPSLSDNLSFDSLDSSCFRATPIPSPTPPRQRILIISEYLPGGNLRSYIAESEATHPFPWRLRVSFSIDVARALCYMHARRCMHRDLKGENMLITANQRVKLCDFGFSRIAARNEEEMKRMSYCGSTPTMSPEIMLGLDFSIETDVFSLGIVFCEILSRTIADEDIFARAAPFYALDVDEVNERKSPGCPDDYLKLALDCCATEARDRPTMMHVLERLRAIERQLIVEERKDSTVKSYHVGSLAFASPSRKTIVASRGGMPSFDGEPAIPIRDGSILAEVDSSEDEDHDVRAAAAVLGIQPAARQSGSRIVVDAPYSIGVVRRSRIRDAPVDTSASDESYASVITIKAVKRDPPIRAPPPPPLPVDRPSLTSLPSAWLISKDVEPVTSSDSSTPVTPELQTIPLDAAPSFVTARTSALSVAAATVDGQHEVEPAPPPSPRAAMLQSLLAGAGDTLHEGGVPHRFSLVSPAWARIFGNPLAAAVAATPTTATPTPTPAASRNTSMDLQQRPSSVPDGVVQLSHGQLKTHCACCARKLGMLLRAYMQCDDCAARFHVKCADIAAPDCAHRLHDLDHSIVQAGVLSTIPAGPTSRAVKGKLPTNRLRRGV